MNRTDSWPERFGTIKKIVIKAGHKGEFAIVTTDCKAFTQVALAFDETVVARIKEAGVGARIWFKGPIETIERRNGSGRTFSQDRYKIVYFNCLDETESSQPDLEEIIENMIRTQADLQRIKGMGPACASKLAAAGSRSYAPLCIVSDEELDAISMGLAKRARRNDWRSQAYAMMETNGTGPTANMMT